MPYHGLWHLQVPIGTSCWFPWASFVSSLDPLDSLFWSPWHGAKTNGFKLLHPTCNAVPMGCRLVESDRKVLLHCNDSPRTCKFIIQNACLCLVVASLHNRASNSRVLQLSSGTYIEKNLKTFFFCSTSYWLGTIFDILTISLCFTPWILNHGVCNYHVINYK